MIKKIIIIVLGVFFIINIFSLKAFYDNFLGIKSYNEKGFNNSISYFENANNKEGVYNKANSLYKQKKYKKSILEYKSILTDEKKSIDFKINYNIGNIFYRLGEKTEKIKKIKNWEESIKFYKNALDIRYDEETKKNLEFVLNKIKEEKQNKDNKKDKESDGEKGKKNKEGNKKEGSTKQKEGESSEKEKGNEEGNKKEGSTKQKEGESSEKEKGNEEGNKQTNGSKGKTNEKGKQKNEKGLSKGQEEAIKKYEEALKKEQEKNADNFNKVYKENINNNSFDNFFNDPFFNNRLLKKGNEKKDW